MNNPLNDPEAFAAVCAGAGGAFGFAACVTLGEPYSASFARLSIITLIISAAMYITLRLADKLEDEDKSKEKSPATSANAARDKGDDIEKNHTYTIAENLGVVKEDCEK